MNFYKIWEYFQRFLAIFLFGMLIFIILPILVLTWFYDFKNPLFIHSRVGKKGQLFKMVKLRTMKKNSYDCEVKTVSNKNSNITPLGYFCRKYKLDEFFQLINVALGQMNLIGPRPLPLYEFNLYTEKEKNMWNEAKMIGKY